MPEPEESEKLPLEIDLADRDVDDPLDNGSGKPKFKHHILLILWCVFPHILLDTWFGATHFVSFANMNYKLGFGLVYGMFNAVPGCATLIMSCRGLCFQALAARGVWMYGFGFMAFVIELPYSHTMIYINSWWGLHSSNARLSEAINMLSGPFCGFGAPIFVMISFDAPKKYGRRTVEGVCCCEGVPIARMMRAGLFATLVVIMFNYNVCKTLAGMGGSEDAFIAAVVFPVLTFAWKRAMYVGITSFSIEDAPFKNFIFPSFGLYWFLQFNAGVAWSGCVAQTWNNVASFFVVDWFLCYLRMAMLCGWGMKQAPKLFHTVLAKQLENVPSPMPRCIAANGPVQAMKLHQAFFCLCENISLTASFLTVLIAYIFNNLLLQEPLGYTVFTGRTLAFPIALCLSDCVQDLICGRFLDKFSDYSFIYFGLTTTKLSPLTFLVHSGLALTHVIMGGWCSRWAAVYHGGAEIQYFTWFPGFYASFLQ